MTIVYASGTKNRRMLVVRDDLDAGAGPAKLKIYDAGFVTLLASIALDDPASSVAGDTLTLLGLPNEALGLVDGTAAFCRLTDSADNVVVASMTVGQAGSGADAIIDSISIGLGQTVRIRSGSITHG